MPKKSAGILLYRFNHQTLEVLLVHPGGPYWAKKDSGAWSIPKGEFSDDEDPLAAAIREFREETGIEINGHFLPMTPVNQKGKIIYPFALEGDFDTSKMKSNTFSMEWPPKSGRQHEFPEINQAQWYNIHAAKQKINQYQAAVLDELIIKLDSKVKREV